MSALQGTRFLVQEGDDFAQGEIGEEISPGVFQAKVYSWIDGRVTHYRLKTVSEMCEARWQFYDNEDEFRRAAERVGAETTRRHRHE